MFKLKLTAMVCLILLGLVTSGYAVVNYNTNTNIDSMPLGKQSNLLYATGENVVNTTATESELINILHTGSYEEKVDAAKQLAAIGTETAVQPLIEAIIDDSKQVRVGATGYPEWERGELARIAEGALVAIGHAIEPAVSRIAEYLDYGKLPDGQAAFIPVCRVLAQVGGKEELKTLSSIATYEKYYPPFREAAKNAAMEIQRRLEIKGVFSKFMAEGKNEENIENLGELSRLLESVKYEMADTLALNVSDEYGDSELQYPSAYLYRGEEAKMTNLVTFIEEALSIPQYAYTEWGQISIEREENPDGTISDKIHFESGGRERETITITRNDNGAIIGLRKTGYTGGTGYPIMPVDIRVSDEDIASTLKPFEGKRVSIDAISGYISLNPALKYQFKPGSSIPDKGPEVIK